MPDPAVAGSARQDYRGEPPSGTPPERVRVALVLGSGSVATDDLYRLLRRRLLVVCSIIAGFFFVVESLKLLLWLANSESTIRDVNLFQWFRWDWRQLLLMTTGFVLAAALGRWPPRTVRGLRLVELVVVGAMASAALDLDVDPFRSGFLEEAARQRDPRVRFAYRGWYINYVSLQWFLILTLYGTFIPNTWRRCAAVVAVVASSPLVLITVQGLWVRPIDPQVLRYCLTFIGSWVVTAAVIAVLACSRIEILYRQVGEARKLGQYVMKEKLGEGGMGEVYRAEHVLLRRPCALKLIRPERAGDPKNLRRFEREVQVTATLTHPNTVQIYDYGRADDGTFYYVMEYLPGPNLEQLVKQQGPLVPERAVHLLRQLCGTLREAHAAGLIHRDIKPTNVIVCERGGLHDVAKLLDFGIVDTPRADPGEAITAHGQFLGTPAYMSAEQAAGAAELDERSDLYSLGATAYFILTGQPPFDRPTINLTIAAQLRDPVTPPRHLRMGVPADLSALIVKCLEKDPAQRFQDAAELDRALAACKCAGGWTDERAAEAAQSPPPGGEAQLSTRELERRWGI